MHFLRKTKKTQSKTLCSILAASIIFSSIVPTIVFAEEDENIPEPTATSIVETTKEIVETTVEPTETTVDENVKSIPEDETTPTTDVTKEIEEPPIEETEATTTTETTVESTTEATTTTVEETTKSTEETTATEATEPSETTQPTETEPEVKKAIVTASSYDEYFDLISKLPDGYQRIIVDTSADLSSLEVEAGVYYDGTYILVFNSQSSFVTATNYIKNAGYNYAIDGTMTVCEVPNNGTTTEAKINPNAKVRVAVIDTGSNNANEYYSVIGDYVKDDNGHGTKMCNFILGETNDAYLISIKALNKDGEGQMSDVYAAVQFAEDLGVDYILMSISIRDGGKYEAFKELVSNTKAKVVASAGNNGTDAKKYLPAGINNVITVGAVRADSYILSTSNYGTCVNYYAPARSTSEAAAKVVGKLIANAYDLQTIAFMLDEDTYYLEGSEYHFSTNDYRFRHGAYTFLSAADLGYGDFNTRMLKYCTDDNLSDANASYSYGLNAAGGAGFHANNNSKTYEPGGCIQFVMSAVAWTAKNNEHSKFTSGYGYKIDYETGCSTFMRNAGFTANPTNYGADLDSAWDGTSSNYDKAIATNNQLYRYLRDYAKPGDVIMFGATWDSGTPWHHAAIYAGPAYYETPTGDLPHPETYDDHWRYEYYFGGDTYPDNCYSCSVFYEATQSWPGFRAHMRIIGPSDFFSTRGSKDFDTVVILRGEEAPATVNLTVQKSSTETLVNFPNSYYSFEGAKYTLYSGGTAVKTFTMAANGTTTDTYEATRGSTYTLKETTAGKGFTLDSTTYTITVASNGNISITNSNGATVDNSGTVKIAKVKDVPEFPDVTLTKIVANDHNMMTTGNSCYSLDGTTYKAYTSMADAQADRSSIGTIVFNASGTPKSNTIPKITYGTVVYLKETAAGKGFKVSDDIYRVVAYSQTSAAWGVNSGALHDWVISGGHMNLTVSDVPVDDPISLRLYKINGSGQKTSAVITGAVFRLEYYAQDIDINASVSGITPTAVYQISGVSSGAREIEFGDVATQTNGITLVSGNGSYFANIYAQDNDALYPLGTYRLYEYTAPAGYETCPEVFRYKIFGSSSTNSGTDRTIVKENGGSYSFFAYTVSADNLEVIQDETPSIGYYTLTKLVNPTSLSKAGYNFEIYNGADLIATGVSQEDGRVLWTYKLAGLKSADNRDDLTGKTTYKLELAVYDANNQKINYQVRELVKTVTYKDTGIPFKSICPAGWTDNTTYYSKNVTLTARTTASENTTNDLITNRTESTGATVVKNDITSEGAKTYNFRLYWYGNGAARDESAKTLAESFTITTDANGVGSAAITGLPLGWYEIVEVDNAGNPISTNSGAARSVAYASAAFNGTSGANNAVTVINRKAPTMSTQLVDNNTNSHVASLGSTVNFTDKVTYNGLTAGTYYVTGTIYDKSTNAPLTINGNTVTGRATFTVASKKNSNGIEMQQNGTVNVVYAIDTTGLEGKTLVAYEEIRTDSYTGNVLVEHKNINDTEQTIYVPRIRTTMLDSTTNAHVAANNNITLVDTITYNNLVPNVTYNIKGVLMNADGTATSIATTSTFTPNAASGSTTISYSVSRNQIDNTKVISYVELSLGNVLVAEHKNLADANQTVYFPKVKTTLQNSIGAESHIDALLNHYGLTDTISVTNALPGATYKVYGILYDKSTGNPFKDANGNNITVTSNTFTVPNSGNTVVNVTFEFDATITKGTVLVAFEDLIYVNGNTEVVVAEHRDIDDFDQSVHIPTLKTTLYDIDLASDKDTARNVSNLTLRDTVELEGLIPGETYTLVSTIMVKGTTPEVLTQGSKTFTTTTTFKASNESQSVDIDFTGIDATKLGGKTLVCYETLKYGDFTLVQHNDINDAAQTVQIPDIRTTLVNVATNSHIVPSTGNVTLRDTVSFTNLIVGKEYMLSGELMFSDGTSTGVTATKYFETSSANGTVTIDFTIDGSAFKNKTIVAFEDLKIGTKTVATHADLTDEDQTVYTPGISTSLIDAKTNDHITEKSTNVKLVDTVTYRNLVPNVEYTMTGTLMDKKTQEPVKKADGSNVTSSKKFTPTSADGTVQIEFTLDTTNYAGETFVAFEVLTYGSVTVASHEEFNDVKQTVYVPDLATTFYDKDLSTDKDTAKSYENITLVDTVEYKNLIPDKTYTLTGTIMVKDTNEPLKGSDGNPITVTKTFKPESANGSTEIEFANIDGKLLEGKTTVAFETLTYEGIDIVVHADIDDEEQTVKFPKIRTQLKSVDTTDEVVPAKSTVTLEDTVTYTNLIVGKEYTVTGKLMYADGTGEVPDVTVTASTFTPDTPNGTTVVKFTFDSSVLQNKTLVAFEDLYIGSVKVASHADITDKNQTVYIPEIHTTLLDKVTDQHVSAEGEVTVVDSVSCNNLVIGKEYTLNGVLMNKKTNESLKNVDGTEVTATLTWTAEAKNEVKKLTFKFDSALLDGGTTVAFESLEHKGIEVATHNNLNDYEQTVYVPSVYTELFDEKFVDTPEVKALTRNFTEVNIVDKVYVSNLDSKYTYKLHSDLYIREDTTDEVKTPFCNADGEQYAKTITFTTADLKNVTVDPVTGAVSGMIEVKYTIDATLLSGKHIVAFESIDLVTDSGSVSLVAHADPKNDLETVSIPEIGTTAKDKVDGDQMLDGTKTTQTVVDTISYKGLVPGVEYVATGKLVIKKNYAEGEEYEYVKNDAGEILTVSVPFTPTAENSTIDADTGAASGTVEVEFTFDASKYANKYIVAFETVTYKGIEVAVHADLEDEGQTIKIPVLLHVQIVKVDGNNVKYALKGAEITIYQVALDAEGNPVLNEKGEIDYVVAKDIDGKDCIAVTDKSGQVNFTVMYDEHFKYFARETKAPKGYDINNKYFEILPTEDRESAGVCLIPIDIADFLIPPKTGDSMNLGLYMTLALIGTIGMLGGIYFIHKKKEENC